MEQNKDKDTFNLLVYNDKLKTNLFVVGNKNTNQGFITTDIEVYYAPYMTVNQFLEDGEYPLYRSVPPIARASMRSLRYYSVVDQMYVGKTFRRNGVGSMLLEIGEELSSKLGYNSLYVSKAFPNAHEIADIKLAHSNLSTARQIIEKVKSNIPSFNHRSNASKFLNANNFVSDNPYRFPFKQGIKDYGYFENCNDATANVLRCTDTDIYLESLKQDKEDAFSVSEKE